MEPHSRIRIPASSANLGPGFDAIAVALSIYLRVRFRQAPQLRIEVSGRDAEAIPTDASNLIWQTAQRVAEDVQRQMPPIELEIVNDIPVGKGLGSSAAALIAGVVIADKVLKLKWPRQKILEEAAKIEGHPDNVSACVLGSITASAIDDGAVTRAIRLELPPGVHIAVVVPNYDVPTEHARAVLPDCYSRQDAVFNVQRASLLVAALATGHREALPLALQDRLHQPYREKLVPGLEQATQLRLPGLLGCVLSGAGPSLLVFYEEGAEEVCEQVRLILEKNGHEAEIFWTDLDQHGYQLEEAV